MTTEVDQPATLAPLLALSGVAMRFGSAIALAGIDLDVGRGEILCLAGHSGCGKSTLLRVIAGVQPNHDGSVVLDGRVLAGPSRFVEPEERRIGYMLQDHALFPHLTVARNVAFGLDGIPRAAARDRARRLMEMVGVGHLGERYPHMLSGGEQQRVALARALAPDPSVLLMDEPFSSLDRGLRERVREETIALLRGLGTTVVLVSHDPEEALSSGDRVVLMKDGRIVQVGTGRDLYDRPASRYAAEFFGGFNTIPGRHSAGRVHTPVGAFEVSAGLPDQASAVVYVRPHAVAVSETGGGLRATVRERAFLGEVEQLLVAVDDLSEPLRIRTSRRLPQGVETVFLSFDRKAALAFAA
jgi:iron(III) transport system ATP-binding protein